MLSDTERLKQYVYFGGKRVEYLKQATIFGKPYYDIIVNGIRRTVPASMCTAEPKQDQTKTER